MQHSIKITGVTLVLLLLSCTQKDNAKDMSQTAINSPIQNDSCDSPDANINCYFVNMPESLTATMTISDNDKGSEKLIITGNIYKKDGKTPYPNAILYAYHTDSKGEYSKKGNEKGVQKWHGSHHGWCKTDQNGNYRIETIRPASYPNSSNPQHIHAAIKLQDNNKPFHIDDFMFEDDPLLQKIHHTTPREKGGLGVIKVKRINGIWIGKRDIVLK